MLTKEQGKGTWALPKNLTKAFEDYLAKEGCLEDPFSKQSLRNYQPCVSASRTPEQHKECVNQQSTKHCQSQLLPNTFILQLWRNIPLTTMTSIVFCLEIMQWKENASTLTQDLVWDDIEGHLLEQLVKPIHAMTYECYTCYNISIYNETNCGRYADWCSPSGVGAPKWLWSGFQYHLAGCKARKLYGITVVNNTENRT